MEFGIKLLYVHHSNQQHKHNNHKSHNNTLSFSFDWEHDRLNKFLVGLCEPSGTSKAGDLATTNPQIQELNSLELIPLPTNQCKLYAKVNQI